MLRIKLFALFIAYAMVALVRPREMRKMLDAADRGDAALKRDALRAAIHHNGPPDYQAAKARLQRGQVEHERRVEEWKDWAIAAGICTAEEFDVTRASLECPVPPPGWRCTRAAGHDGPCAAVAK